MVFCRNHCSTLLSCLLGAANPGLSIEETPHWPGGISIDQKARGDRFPDHAPRAHDAVALHVRHDDCALADPGLLPYSN
jgi:hypothetical protein